MPNNIIHLPGNINASQILYEDNLNIRSKINNIQTSIAEASDNFNEELENIETQLNNKITELNQKISNIINASYTETQAITHSSTNPNTIYFSTDTNCVIINGEIYGRGQHLSNVFKLIPSGKTIGSTGYNDTNVIYIQPDGTNFTLYYYSINNTWESIGNIAFDIAIYASDITYDLTNTPDLGNGDVQSAVEALDGKVEELRDEVLGDEWVDEIFGRKADWIRQYCYLGWNGNIAYSGYSDCYGFEIKTGDTFHFIDRRHSMNPMWIAYTEYKDLTGSSTYSGTMPTKVSDECDPDNIGQNARVVDHVQTFSSETKMVIVAIEHNADWYQRITSNRGTPLSIADKTGYKIDTWTDDEIITSTTLAVGSIMPSWSDGTRYGGRGVRLNVKEGDKILLDTYSPALFGLIFTDENRVVKALYDDRRFDGVWTAPVNGYCYIQDVLYRDNFHYASAHGHLAYMAHDARKRVAKGGDWYNEYAMRRITQILPLELSFKKTGSATNGWVTQFSVDGASNLTAMNGGQYVLVLFKYYVYEDSATSGTMATNGSTGIGTAVYIQGGVFTPGTYQYTYRIYRNVTNAGTHFGAYWYNISTEENTHVRFENVFLHSSYDFAELYKLAQKIINGEVEVDNFYGVREKEVDFVKNAIGLQSISDLGYNILEHGATLPIDEDGYKYAKEIYDRYKDNPPTSAKEFQTQFRNDLNLVYFPHIDLSHMSGVATDLLISAFLNCQNLIACSELIFGDDAPANNNAFNGTFNGCYSLKAFKGVKMVNDNGISMYQCFTNCYSLEYVGILDLYVNSISLCFQNCYSLERIEEIRVKKLAGFHNASFSNCTNLHFMLMKNIGHSTAVTTWYYAVLTNWGIPNDKHPDARQSLVDSLLTYSYDRVNDPDGLGTAGTTCTITLSVNSYNQLTTEEIDAITAKGYTLTHP